MKKNEVKVPVALDVVAEHIFVIRGQRFMLDIDLARLYEVPVKRLKEQVRRNRTRFPSDFFLALSLDQTDKLLRSRPQNATLIRGRRLVEQL